MPLSITATNCRRRTVQEHNQSQASQSRREDYYSLCLKWIIYGSSKIKENRAGSKCNLHLFKTLCRWVAPRWDQNFNIALNMEGVCWKFLSNRNDYCRLIWVIHVFICPYFYWITTTSPYYKRVQKVCRLLPTGIFTCVPLSNKVLLQTNIIHIPLRSWSSRAAPQQNPATKDNVVRLKYFRLSHILILHKCIKW